MSTYKAQAFHPETGILEEATFIDDFYGKHRYGVQFAGDRVYRAEQVSVPQAVVRDRTEEERSAALAASKEAGAPGKEIEITPEMIEAGVRVLASEWGVIGEVAAEELAEDVYRAMSGPHCAAAIRALKEQAAEYARPVLKKRPVAFRVNDFADGWIIFQDEEAANREAERTGATMQGLYVRDGQP